ncbi:TVP38/TMEM64 family protein [Desulfitobacterium chlororespirans]|uniref:TVP38/TMEM64 family membrane protein n=1 Tax=Desulfitobacterium chlororespirans DSM 11544 TaxID=1121395 RepID=A0A1M7UXW0_9FIRM|nr:VTT domain-containing protein [Desulfitobacterium chlororespirans]SHN87871.1 Uncharacterized membrane protein YdjX, TVP38/TMEM64 family, SNARE-associated domain [Desulfitobacterium chlororespirans DSM 11544]
MSRKKLTSAIVLLLSLVIIGLLYPQIQHPDLFQDLILDLGWKGVLLDLLALSLLMFFPIIPFALLAGINIVIYGWSAGFLLSLTGSLLGSSLAFFISRLLGQEWARPHLNKLGKWGKLSDSKNFSLIILARLIFILPAAAVNYAAGVSPIRFRSFFLATLIGNIPIILWESWFGHDFWHLLQYPRRFSLALLTGAVIFSCAWLLWQYIDRQEKPST